MHKIVVYRKKKADKAVESAVCLGVAIGVIGLLSLAQSIFYDYAYENSPAASNIKLSLIILFLGALFSLILSVIATMRKKPLFSYRSVQDNFNIIQLLCYTLSSTVFGFLCLDYASHTTLKAPFLSFITIQTIHPYLLMLFLGALILAGINLIITTKTLTECLSSKRKRKEIKKTLK